MTKVCVGYRDEEPTSSFKNQNISISNFIEMQRLSHETILDRQQSSFEFRMLSMDINKTYIDNTIQGIC